MDTRGKLIVISGFSGVGKGTVIRKLMTGRDDFAFSVSCTTRDKREGEVEGQDYFYMDRETFQRRIREGRFLEYAEYAGNYYGTPARYVYALMNRGINVILDIEFQGAFQVKEKYPKTMMLFLLPPSAGALVDRLVKRGTESSDQIRMRVAQALTEADMVFRYEGILVNETVDQTVKDILSIVENPARMREFYERNSGLVRQIRADLNGIIKTW